MERSLTTPEARLARTAHRPRRSPLRWPLRLVAPVAAAGILALPALSQSQPTRIELVVAATTDVHGRLRGWDYFTNAADPAHSLAGAATIVDSLRRVHPGRVVLVDGGDLLQGNPLTYVAGKVSPPPVHPVVAAMNVMQYDAAVLGNHEFNYGVPLLRRAIAQAGFPFLAANVHENNGRTFVAPFTIVERPQPRGGTVRIGIVGGTTPGSMVWDADHLREARLTVSDIVPAVRRAVEELRRRNVDVVIALLHSGLSGAATYDTIATRLPSENVAARIPQEIPGVDLVVFGHSHREVIDTTINGALVIQPRNWAESVGVATLTLEKTGRGGRGRWQVVARRGQAVRVAGHKESERVLAATITTHRATVAWANSPIGRTAVPWRADSARVADMPLTDLIGEVMRRASGAQLAATAAFSLDAGLDTGAITLAMLSKLYPYENTLRVLKVSGAQLRAFLEHSAKYYRSVGADGSMPAGGIIDASIPGYNFDMVNGADYVIDLTKPIGSRVTSLLVAGRAVVDSDSFTFALNNYRAGGGGGYAMLADAPRVPSPDVDIRQLLIDEVNALTARGETLDPAKYATRNWQLLPASAVSAAYSIQTRGRGAESNGRAPANATGRSAIISAPSVRVIAFSDYHAAISARPDGSGRPVGGSVALSAAIRRAEQECVAPCRSVVVHAGDLFSGAPASDWDAGRPTVAVMNRLGVAAGALGNHEFDFGIDTLRQRLRELDHRLLGVNVRDNSNRMPDWVRADTIVDRGGVRIGIVGAAGTHTATSTKRRNVSTLTFLDPAPLISERISSLRAAGAQIVIGLIHDGARCEIDRLDECSGEGLNVARKLTERPDAFIIGHAHVNLSMRINGFPVVEPSSSGRAIQIVDIPLGGGEATMTLRQVSGADVAGADPVVDSIVRASVAKVRARMERRVAVLADPMPRTGTQYALGNMMADAVRVMGAGDFGAWNNGGIRVNLPAGPLTYGGVHELTPFGNVLVKLRLRGKDVRDLLERGLGRGRPDIHVSGLSVEFDGTKPRGQRIERVTLTDGRPLDDTRIYTFVINDFMIDDPDGALDLPAISREFLPIRDIDAISAYLERLPQPVRGDTAPRMRDINTRSSR